MLLTRLIYASKHDSIIAETLDRILQTSRGDNVRDGITGAPVIGEPHFLQLLEGDRSAIGRCMMRVMQDNRHHGIQVISTGEVAHRLFYEWSMHSIETSRMEKGNPLQLRN